MNKKEINDSKYLSYLLRHHPEDANCSIDEYGWVDVQDLINNTDFTMEYLKNIVENDTRYTFSSDYSKIRAFHGHSVPVIYQNEITPPNVLYHGTSEKNKKLIMESGFIKAMSRAQVHLSENVETAIKIGSRHGSPIVLKIDSDKMFKDGIKFYKSEDGVYLTSDIDIKYIIP